MKDLHLFALADIAGLSLHKNPSRPHVYAMMTRPFTVGPWKAHTGIEAVTDFVEDEGAALLMYVRKDLYFYIVRVASGQSNMTVLFAFDGKRAGVGSGKLEKFCTGDMTKTLLKIKPSITAMFLFNEITQSWEPTDAASMDRQTEGSDIFSDQYGNQATP